MSSADFEKKLIDGKIEETLETIDWNMELTALRLLENKFNCLNSAVLI